MLLHHTPLLQKTVMSCPSAPLLHCCIFPAAMVGFPMFNFSLLTDSCTDINISFLISSITFSSCSNGWFSLCSLLGYTSSLSMGRSTRSPLIFSSSLVALSFHPDASFSSVVLSLSCYSASPSNNLASSSSPTDIFPSSSNCSLGWYAPSISNLIYWMC
jgi:hypothetical protein